MDDMTGCWGNQSGITRLETDTSWADMYYEGYISFLFRWKMQFGRCCDSCRSSPMTGKTYLNSFGFRVVFADFEQRIVESCEQARQMRIDEQKADIKFQRFISIRSRAMIDFVASEEKI